MSNSKYFYTVWFNSYCESPIGRTADNLSEAIRMAREGERDGYVVRVFDYFGNKVEF